MVRSRGRVRVGRRCGDCLVDGALLVDRSPHSLTPMFRTSLKFVALMIIGAALGGCDSFLSPDGGREKTDDEITVIHVDPEAPPLQSTEISFWIVRGEEKIVEIRYEGPSGYNGKCLRLVIPANAPLRDAAGNPIAPGDSILATVRVMDAGLFLFELEPAGLILNPASPARMEVRYRWMSDDLNGDGVVDGLDARARDRLGIWARDPATERWSSIESTRFEDISEIHAPIRVFTRYALASD